MPSADAETTEDEEIEIVDEARNALLDALNNELGDAIVGTHLLPGKDLWVRVTNESWADTADYLRNRQRFRFFDWLSAIDWMASPYGRSLDAEVDKILTNPAEGVDESDDGGLTGTGADGYTGGETRFQVIARVGNLTTKLGINLKADLGSDLAINTWTKQYPGANWHEREAWEMYGIEFDGHPGLRNIYLPGDFQGHPLRKDFPLLARLVKPWPGIVDVEPMPEEPSAPKEVTAEPEPASAPSTTNPEDAQ